MDFGEVTIAGDWLNILGIHVSLEVMFKEQKAILMCYTCHDMRSRKRSSCAITAMTCDPGLHGLIRQARGTRGPILIRILADLM